MKLLLVLAGFLVAASADDYCFNTISQACKTGSKGSLECTAKYGEIATVENELKGLANKLIGHNFDYMLLATHFNNYKMNRAGFTKLFRKLSDAAWEDSIDLIKYMTKRGVQMDFEQKLVNKNGVVADMDKNYSLSEVESLAKSVDIQKSLAEAVHSIHHSAEKDAEVMSHLENTFVHKLRDTVRDLSGHTNDLRKLIMSEKSQARDSSLNVFLFDEYLSKLY